MRAEPAASVPSLAGLVNAFERMSGVYLTIHDVRGVLSLQESDRLLPGRFLHGSSWCRRDRFERSAWNNLCTFDCKTSVYEELRKKPEPFVKVCWKGVLEVVVPVLSRGRIMLVLYAGVFRRPGQTEPESLTVLPEYYARSFLLLPELSPEREKELVAGLTLLGNALMQELEAIDIISKSGSREQKILQFLKKNAHRQVGIGELAECLNLSVSRTSHTVMEQLGMTFKQALLEERMSRAVYLLNAYPDLPVSRIAETIGYRDEHYFMRCFSKFYGMGPRAYQKAQKAPEK